MLQMEPSAPEKTPRRMADKNRGKPAKYVPSYSKDEPDDDELEDELDIDDEDDEDDEDDGFLGLGIDTAKVWVWARSILLAVLIALTLHTYVLSFAVVSGVSMQPLFEPGTLIALDKFSGKITGYSRNDIIICHLPHRPGIFAKRVIAVEGDMVEIREGRVFVNGRLLSEPYVYDAQTPLEDMPLMTVGQDAVFVLGDYRSESLDSRYEEVGTIQCEQIEGRALAILWPFDAIAKTADFYK